MPPTAKARDRLGEVRKTHIEHVLEEARSVADCAEKCMTGWSDENSRWEFWHEVSGLRDRYSVPKRNVSMMLPAEVAYWLDQRHKTQKATRQATTKRRASLIR